MQRVWLLAETQLRKCGDKALRIVKKAASLNKTTHPFIISKTGT